MASFLVNETRQQKNIMQGDQHFETDYYSSILYIQLLITNVSFSLNTTTLTFIDIFAYASNNPPEDVTLTDHLIDLTRHVYNPNPASYARHGRALYPCLKSQPTSPIFTYSLKWSSAADIIFPSRQHCRFACRVGGSIVLFRRRPSVCASGHGRRVPCGA
jgi:hypothetical protein